MSKFEHKMDGKFAIETDKSMHSVCPTDQTKKHQGRWSIIVILIFSKTQTS